MVSRLASPQTSFGMRDKRTPKDVCGEAISRQEVKVSIVLQLAMISLFTRWKAVLCMIIFIVLRIVTKKA